MGMFDDLIPENSADQPSPTGARSNMFGDLIPQGRMTPEQREQGMAELQSRINADDPVTFGGTAKAFMGGLGRGAAAMAALPNMASEIVNYGMDKAFGERTDAERQAQENVRLFPRYDEAQGAIESVAGPLPEPRNTVEDYASTVGEFVPGAAFGPVRAIGTTVVAPALASETAGQLTEGTAAEPYARLAGALAGPALATGARRMVTPNPIEPTRAARVADLEAEGVNTLTAGQKTGNKPLQYFEAASGGRKAASLSEQQGEQFTSAILKRIGVESSRATPEVLDDAYRNIGGMFDELAARHSAPLDTKLGNELRSIWGRYNRRTSGGEQVGAIRETLEEIASLSKAGAKAMDGARYQKIRSELGKDMRAFWKAGKADAAEAAQDILSSLDAAMERGIAAVDPADLGKWKEARRLYKNFLVVENAATRAGENAALGIISPSALRGAVKTQNKRLYARGIGEFAKLARSGEAVMKPLPTSGTSERLKGQLLTSAVTGAAGGAATGDPYGVLIGLAGPAALARLALSRPGRAYLGNQAIQPNQMSTLQRLAAPSVSGSQYLPRE